MAARKKTKAAKRKKAAKPAKVKKSAARSTKKAAAKATKRPAKKTKKVARKAAKPAAKKITKRTAKKAAGEGDYAASRAFLKDQSGFVEKNKAKIPAMGKAAEAALEGPEGAGLREAEATAAARSRDTF
jgi:hypothetical protein